MDFTDTKILVTGGSRGIGRAAVEVVKAGGARVAVNGRTADSTAAGVTAMESNGLLAEPGDVGTVAGCEAAVSAATNALGGLAVLVNSAGVGHGGPMEDMAEAIWDDSRDVNLKGTFFCIKAALAFAPRCGSTASAPAMWTPTWCAATASTLPPIRPPPNRRCSTTRRAAIAYLAHGDTKFATGAALQIDGGTTAGR